MLQLYIWSTCEYLQKSNPDNTLILNHSERKDITVHFLNCYVRAIVTLCFVVRKVLEGKWISVWPSHFNLMVEKEFPSISYFYEQSEFFPHTHHIPIHICAEHTSEMIPRSCSCCHLFYCKFFFSILCNFWELCHSCMKFFLFYIMPLQDQRTLE